jgi:hypothetical protein
MAEPVLNENQCQCLDKVLQSIAYTRELINKCKDCGLDMDRMDAELEMQKKLAEGLKRNFAPSRP